MKQAHAEKHCFLNRTAALKGKPVHHLLRHHLSRKFSERCMGQGGREHQVTKSRTEAQAQWPAVHLPGLQRS